MTRETLIEILKESVPDVNVTDESILEKSLMGDEIRFGPVEMYRFLMCVENEFHIYFSAEEIETYRMKNLHDFEVAINKKSIKSKPISLLF